MTAPLITEPPSPTAARRTNLLSIVAVIAGFMAPIAGIVTGFVALRQITRTGEDGRALALTGIIAGFALTALQAVFFVVWFTLFFGFTTQSGTLG